MKRNVAVIGPTPQFVRWAIEFECPLRELYLESLPQSTFNQLRSLRELSDALIDGRVFNDYCFAPGAEESSESTLLGFPVTEITDLFGGRQAIKSICQPCPANACWSGDDAWVGCFDWFAGDPDWKPSRNGSGSHPQEWLVTLFNETTKTAPNSFQKVFSTSLPGWYSIWQQRVFHCKELHVLLEILERILTGNVGQRLDPLKRFRNAILRCIENRLPMHCDLVPPGHSNGTQWTVFSHCSDCKCKMDSTDRSCRACGRIGPPRPELKKKVLGLRPYLDLEKVIGPNRANELRAAYRQYKSAT